MFDFGGVNIYIYRNLMMILPFSGDRDGHLFFVGGEADGV